MELNCVTPWHVKWDKVVCYTFSRAAALLLSQMSFLLPHTSTTACIPVSGSQNNLHWNAPHNLLKSKPFSACEKVITENNFLYFCTVLYTEVFFFHVWTLHIQNLKPKKLKMCPLNFQTVYCVLQSTIRNTIRSDHMLKLHVKMHYITLYMSLFCFLFSANVECSHFRRTYRVAGAVLLGMHRQ